MNNRLAYMMGYALVSLTTCIVTFMRIRTLPDTVPVHWNIEGKADRFGSKWELLAIPLVVSLIMFLVFGAIFALGQIPRNSKVERGLGITLVSVGVFFFVIQNNILHFNPSAIVGSINAMLGWLLMIIGFATRGIEPNPYMGVRTSWTLNNPRVWRITHDRAARLWLFTGGVILISSLFAPFWVGIALFMGSIFYPLFDSYRISKSVA